jgi:hypothetical protein
MKTLAVLMMLVALVLGIVTGTWLFSIFGAAMLLLYIDKKKSA